VNAGHNPPLVVRGGSEEAVTAAAAAVSTMGGAVAFASVTRSEESAESQRLTATGLVLGAIADSPYDEESVSLRAGDVVVAYTDGVTEAFGPGGREFGEERLREVVAGAGARCAAEILASVARAVEAWRGGAPAHDDFTLVVAKVL
jgi:sigma-B regulation protein RsbU (phosphoserine phosphatase)